MTACGFLNLNKPSGITSRDAVDRVQRLVGRTKVGHAGTLDPLASGVLIVCLGAATRLVPYVHRLPKSYRATFLLGRRSPTDDIEGEMTELPEAPRPSRDELHRAAARFVGEIEQRPPDFSAAKVKGRRAYRIARAGKQVRLETKRVQVHSLSVVAYDELQLVLDVTCGTGTYIRALGRDLAESLGTAAVMSALVRTSIGPYRFEQSCELGHLTSSNLADHLLPPLSAIERMPVLHLDKRQVADIRNGRAIVFDCPIGDDEWAALDDRGRLIAVLERRKLPGNADARGVGPKLNLPSGD